MSPAVRLLCRELRALHFEHEHGAGHPAPAGGYLQLQKRSRSRKIVGGTWIDRPGRGIRIAAAVAGTFALSFIVSCAPASAAPVTANITVSCSSVPQGDSVTISGNVPIAGSRSCSPADAVQLTSTAGLFPPDGFGPRANRDSNGNFTTVYAIPVSTPVGSYHVGVRCGCGNVGISVTVQVTKSTTTTTAAVTSTVPPTTAALATSTVPPTTTASLPVGGKSNSNSLVVWIVFGALVLLAGVGGVLFFSRR